MQPTPRIVFVLGAGASAEYGLPTAQALCDAVIASPPVVNASHRTDHDGLIKAEMQRFAKALYCSGQGSVDRFIEHQPKYHSVAKIAIAHELFQHTKRAFHLLTDSRRWYSWLFRHLFTTTSSNCADIGIVTFNYDMTLEIALRRMRMSIRDSTNSSDAGELESLRIVHVYGKLESERPESRVLDQWVDGRMDYSPHLIHEIAQGIRLMGDDRTAEANDLLAQAKSLVHGAKCVIFVGFGYDDENMKRIGAHHSFEAEWTRSDKMLYLCGCGLRGEQRKDVLRRIGRGVVERLFGDSEQRAGEWLNQTVMLGDILSRYR